MPVEDFLDKCRREMRLQRLSKRTEETYLRTIRRFIGFHGGKRHPKDMGAAEIRDYLSHLANDQDVAASTQNVAFNALLFLYRNILCIEMPQITGVDRVQRPPRLPEVFTRDEVNTVLSHLQSTNLLMASLLYGAGLRLMECVRLRVKDIDFARHQLTVREGKGDKDRVTMLPLSLEKPLQRQLVIAKAIHDEDLVAGYGSVWLPHALERKYQETILTARQNPDVGAGSPCPQRRGNDEV